VDDIDVVSPASPLGRAITGKFVGDTATFAGPTRQQEVSVVAAVPFA
jgi:transcription elongation GreA/GreB family factor